LRKREKIRVASKSDWGHSVLSSSEEKAHSRKEKKASCEATSAFALGSTH